MAKLQQMVVMDKFSSSDIQVPTPTQASLHGF